MVFDARLRVGFRQLCTFTTDKHLAASIQHMWTALAQRHRAWDLLEPVVADGRSIGALFDAWDETGHSVEKMRQRAKDVNVEPLVAEWSKVKETKVAADSAAHALAHVRHFFPAGAPRLASAITADWIETRLAEYPGKRNTRRTVHSSITGLLDYLVLPKKVLPVNPIAHVERPKVELMPPTFYDRMTVDKIIAWQPDEARRAFFALVYGTAADVSPALLVEREDFDASAKSVRIRGTKTATRDRTARVADWAWPIVWKFAKHTIHGRILSGRVESLDRLRLAPSNGRRRCSRHTWRGRTRRSQAGKAATAAPRATSLRGAHARGGRSGEARRRATRLR